MKVLQVVEPGVDGVFRHVEGLVNFLMGRGCTVGLAYSSRRGSECLKALVSRLNSSGFPTLDLNVGSSPCLRDFLALYNLVRVIDDFRPDVIHAHSSKAGALMRIIGLLGEVRPLFYTPNAYYGMGGRSGVVSAIFNGVERALATAAVTIHVSIEEAQFAREALQIGERSLLISNAVDFAQFTPSDPERKREARAALKLPSERIILGSVGRLSFQKDPETLYKAFAEACRSSAHDLILAHIGEGELDEQVRRLSRTLGIEDRVMRIPYLADPRQFYDAIDAFVLSSRYEGLPFTVLEALACDLPLVLTDAPGLKTFQTIGLNVAAFSSPESPVSLGRAMEIVIDAIASSDHVINHREVGARFFSINQCYSEILTEYKNRAQGDESLFSRVYSRTG